jgi:probable HAF family extracellular repeat protein
MRWFGLLVVGLALLAGVVATVSGGATQAEMRWVITDLGTLGGESGARAINNRGQVVGWSRTAVRGPRHAFLWQAGEMRDLGTLGGPNSQAVALNNNGQVIGRSDTRNGKTHAFLWEEGNMLDLGVLAGCGWSFAVAINDRGQVVGHCRHSQAVEVTPERAFIWERGRLVALGTLGGRSSTPTDINERGRVVGWAETAKIGGVYHTAFIHGFRWANGKIRDLGALGTDSWASAINESGQIVGTSGTTPTWARAFLWQGGRLTGIGPRDEYGSDARAINERGQVLGTTSERAFLWEHGTTAVLRTLGGRAEATDINEHGQVVGKSWVTVRGNTEHAVVWDKGVAVDLGTLGGQRSMAFAINDDGEIAGWSRTGGDRPEWHAVLWTLKRG